MSDSPPMCHSWKFCPRCGSGDAQLGDNPFRCHDCGYQHYFTPMSAVGGLLVDRHGQMLLIVRGRHPAKGKLGLPGGFVDPGESAEEALRREIQEETGIQIAGGRYLASFPNKYEFAGVVADVTDLFFVVELSDLTGGVAQDGEVAGLEICCPGSLTAQDLAFPTHWQALQAWLR